MSGTAATTDTKGLEALLSALNKSAERMQTLWFSFIGLTLYFLVTALTTTHMNLLLNEAQVLPIISMKVPLLPFYVIAPIFYVVIHFYVLLMLVLLARSARVFEDALHRSIRLESERETFRMRLENSLFLQLLVGAAPERSGVNGFLLATMALITIAVAPVVTLLVIQLRFLPYHHFEITWLHRAMVGLDVVLVFLLWRGYRRRWGRPWPIGPVATWRSRGRWWAIGGTAAVVASGLGAGTTAWLTLFEGRWYGEPEAGWASSDRWKRGLIVGKATAFRDRLNVHGETIVGAELFDKAEKESKSLQKNSKYSRTHDFSNRNFIGADFGETDLRRVDFSGSLLHDTSFSQAYMQDCQLRDTQMWRANFSQARAQGANYFRAQMQDASFDFARMQDAKFVSAEMQGVRFEGTQMEGAIFLWAELQGASFVRAHMQGAKFAFAHMQGASFDRAQMQGASFVLTEMQGVNFDRVQAQGASFYAAQMQGADIEATDMSNADLTGVFIWRVKTLSLATEGLIVAYTHSSRVQRPKYLDTASSPLTDADIDLWAASATRYIKIGPRNDATVARFERLKGENADFDVTFATFWSDLEKMSSKRFPDPATRDAHMAAALGDLACDVSGQFRSARPHVARGVMMHRTGMLDAVSLNAIRSRLFEGRKDLAACPGVEGFTEADWTELKDRTSRENIGPLLIFYN